jgi:hypothetical protein
MEESRKNIWMYLRRKWNLLTVKERHYKRLCMVSQVEGRQLPIVRRLKIALTCGRGKTWAVSEHQ